jgi:predicted TIM-barrel fold metal-dependent hydrolase
MPLPSDVRLVSVNDHVVEPPDLWTRGAARGADADEAPQVVDLGPAQGQAWCFGSQQISVPKLAVIAAPGAGAPDGRARRVEDFHPAVNQPAARLAAMDEDRVQVHTLLPHVSGFAGERLRFLASGEAWTAAVRTYNDFVLDEVCAHDPTRLVGVAILPLHDVAATVAELERAVAKGARAVSFPHDPASLGVPSLYTGEWDPLFAAAQAADVPVFVHIGTGGGPASANLGGPTSAGTLLAMAGVDAVAVAADLVFSHVLSRHPRLRVVLLEGGVAWIPYLDDRMTFFLRREGVWPTDGSLLSPVEVLRAQVAASFIEDPTGVALRDEVGIDRLLWQTDFPHADTYWPHSRDQLEAALVDVPEADARAIGEENARALLHLPRG